MSTNVLRIAVNEWKPGALDLDHDAVTGPERMANIGVWRELDSLGLIRRGMAPVSRSFFPEFAPKDIARTSC